MYCFITLFLPEDKEEKHFHNCILYNSPQKLFPLNVIF